MHGHMFRNCPALTTVLFAAITKYLKMATDRTEGSTLADNYVDGGGLRGLSHLRLPPQPVLSILTDSSGSLQLTPLTGYAASHPLCLDLSVSIPPSLAHIQLQLVH